MIEPDHRGSRMRGPVPSPAGEASNVGMRVASALVLAPVVLVITYFGGWPFLTLCALAAGGILWEWVRLVGHGADVRALGPGLAALIAASALAGLNRPAGAALAIVFGALVAGAAVAVRPRAPDWPSTTIWAAGGVVYAGMLLISPALLRGDPAWGLTAVLFLIVTVWVTDIFAFGVGNVLDGPLLWPRVSPKKTWAGAFGGAAGGVAAGVVVAYASGIGRPAIAGGLALLLSVLAQAGDLFESAVKRRFGAKDASQLIPGHGGLMDRLDGFLVAAFAALVIGIIRQGTNAPARGLLLW